MRLSTVILPVHRWPQAQHLWRRAEELGFHAAYTYDHISWRDFRDRTWFGAVPTLTAAALVTERIRLGPLVASPNFRHPVLLAKDLMTLDDLSGGRLTAGVGAGAPGFDADVLGGQPPTDRERACRFKEFVSLLDQLLSRAETTYDGDHYSAHGARMIPGCVQRPRVPFFVAATGRLGLRLAARHGQGWVTYGAPRDAAGVPAEKCPQIIAAQLDRLSDACVRVGRDPDELEKVLLKGAGQENPTESLEAFVDFAGRYRDLGITEIVLPWPTPDSDYDYDLTVFEEIATHGLARLGP